MFEYLLTGAIVLGFMLVGAACVVWPRRMRWVTRGVITLALPAHVHDVITRVAGAALLAGSLVVAFFIVRNLP